MFMLQMSNIINYITVCLAKLYINVRCIRNILVYIIVLYILYIYCIYSVELN